MPPLFRSPVRSPSRFRSERKGQGSVPWQISSPTFNHKEFDMHNLTPETVDALADILRDLLHIWLDD